jgi:hypothetical protein
MLLLSNFFFHFTLNDTRISKHSFSYLRLIVFSTIVNYVLLDRSKWNKMIRGEATYWQSWAVDL